MNSYLIRQAEPKDLPEIIQLCIEHAAFEQADYSPSGKADKLSAHLFNNPPACFCLVVEMDGALAGYATYSKEFSTWDADFYIHMDCLFLRPHARSMGVGEQLIKQIAQSAQALNCRLIQWQTPKFNARAVKFYKRIGATEKEKLRFFLTVDA